EELSARVIGREAVVRLLFGEDMNATAARGVVIPLRTEPMADPGSDAEVADGDISGGVVEIDADPPGGLGRPGPVDVDVGRRRAVGLPVDHHPGPANVTDVNAGQVGGLAHANAGAVAVVAGIVD